MVQRKPAVSVFVRHRDSCRFAGDESYPKCDCPKWLRYSLAGKQRRENANTRTWGLAEEKARDRQRELDGLTSTGAPAPEVQPSIEQSVETYVTAKTGEGVTVGTLNKLRYQLGLFEKFMAARSKYFPAEITPADVIEYRAGWGSWKSGVTQQKAQQNLRGFLRSCCKTNLADLLAALKTIKLSKADKKRLKPQPFTETELRHLLAQVPKTFPEPQAAKMTALIHCMVSTGLAIRDTVQLERENLADGWLRIERQKTGKSVRQKLDAGLSRELMAVANGNPTYLFWNGASKVTSAVGQWQDDLKLLMQDAGLWIKGNLSHRFRDTAVDFWLGEGCSLTDIAAMLGDTVAVVEAHYADLASKRTEGRLAKLPSRSWN